METNDIILNKEITSCTSLLLHALNLEYKVTFQKRLFGNIKFYIPDMMFQKLKRLQEEKLEVQEVTALKQLKIWAHPSLAISPTALIQHLVQEIDFF